MDGQQQDTNFGQHPAEAGGNPSEAVPRPPQQSEPTQTTPSQTAEVAGSNVPAPASNPTEFAVDNPKKNSAAKSAITSALVLVVLGVAAVGILGAFQRNRDNNQDANNFYNYQQTSSVQHAAPAAVAPAVFRNVSGKLAFTYHLQTGQTDSGNFDLDIAGIGSYQGTIAPKQTGNDESLNGTASVAFYPADGSLWSTVPMHLAGTLYGAPPKSADVTFTVGLNHYHLVAGKSSR